MKILMVCLGNICRSPMAEGVLQQMADEKGLDWKIDSSGTNGFHTGEPPHQLSIKIARLNGVDISRQRSRKLTTEDFEQYDVLYAMAADVIRDMRWIAGKKYNASRVRLFLEELYPGQNRDVPDPWYGGERDYIEVFDLISKNCQAIISKKFQPEDRKQRTNVSGPKT